MRPFAQNDLDALAEMFADPEVMRYLPAGQGVSRERTQVALSGFIESWETRGHGLFAVVSKNDQTLIGHCGLAQLEYTEEIELAYGFARPYWGQGYATEAAQASLAFGFEDLGLDQIAAIVVPENIASRRVLEKCGMRYVRDTSYYNLDVHYFLLTLSEYRLNPPNGSSG